MELEKLKGSIIGVINYQIKKDDFSDSLVKDIITNKPIESLKMVRLEEKILEKKFNELSSRDKNKVILASKLHDKIIILNKFTKGMIKSDIIYFTALFKRIVKYDKKIILIDSNTEIFLNCVDNIVVFNNNDIIYETKDIYDINLSKYCDLPKIVDFINISVDLGVHINHYLELDELLKAIYRIKS